LQIYDMLLVYNVAIAYGTIFLASHYRISQIVWT
jgi:hypothetical protein